MTSRSAILKRIATAGHGAKTSDATTPSGAAQTPEPARMRDPALLDRFTQQMKDNGITTRRCQSAAEIPSCVADLAGLSPSNPQQVCVAPHLAFQNCDWRAAGVKTEQEGGWKESNTVALSHARLGIADSGCLVLASGEDSPTGLAFLPEIHIIALERGNVVATLTDAMVQFRDWQTTDGNRLPRAINMISGASRTADIAGKIVHGAHGPRKLCVIVYGDA